MTHSTEMREETQQEYPLADAGMPGSVETILYVEDEAFVREVTAEVLLDAGYHVLVAKTAKEAACLYEAQRGEVDLLLTDVVLPGETGHTLASRLRHAHPTLKVLFVTGYAEQMTLRESEFESCLAKPFPTQTLLGRIRGLLGPHESELNETDSGAAALSGSLEDLGGYLGERDYVCENA